MATLVTYLEAAAARQDRGITFLGESGPVRLTYAELARTAARVAGGLRGVQAEGMPLLIIYPTSVELVAAFWGAIWAGLIPAPLPLPRPFGDAEEYARRIAHCSARAGGAPVATTPAIAALLAETAAGRHLRTLDISALGGGGPVDAKAAPTAMLQFTSGSLSDPKGVMLSHGALIANARAIVERWGGADATDVMTTWVPLVHDMGLIGGHLTALVHGFDSVLVPTDRFLADPELWLRALHEFGATLTCSPPFGYGLALRRANPARYDLRRLRHAVVGAEPIDARVLRAFVEKLGPAGLSPQVFRPAYGMAECCVAASMTTAGSAFSTIQVAAGLTPGQAVRPVAAGEGLEIVGTGAAVAGLEIVVADAQGGPLPELTIGEIRIRGASRFDGYWGDAEATAHALDGEWLKTGDLGFFRGGDLFIAGRRKDVIIRRGRHYFPEEIEAIVYDVPGVRPRGALAFGEVDPSGGAERISVVIETAEPEDKRAAIAAAAVRAIADRLDCNVDSVVFCNPRELPRTPSGKIRRGEGRLRWGSDARNPSANGARR